MSQKPYFGGERDCNAEQRAADYNPAELVCGGCSNFGNKNSCTVHGNDFMYVTSIHRYRILYTYTHILTSSVYMHSEYKCRFCCSVACWFCWGTTHFCEPCHRIATEIAKRPKKGTCSMLLYMRSCDSCRAIDLPKCTCTVQHPPNGDEYCLGCSLCRIQQEF